MRSDNKGLRCVAMGAAVLALLLQAALGVLPCKAIERANAGAEPAHRMIAGVLCTMEGARTASSRASEHPGEETGLPTQEQNGCPVCANGCAHVNALPLPDETFVAAPLAAPVAFVADPARDPADVAQLAFRSRGPPVWPHP